VFHEIPGDEPDPALGSDHGFLGATRIGPERLVSGLEGVRRRVRLY
jgi:hypothetical protein